MKIIRGRVIMIGLMALVIAFQMSMPTMFSEAATGNLGKAMKKYKVPESRVITVEKLSISELEEALDEASGMATASKPFIVFVPKGKMNDSWFTVPRNVILVSRQSVKYNDAAVKVKGSVYGGTFDSRKNRAISLEIDVPNYKKPNGVVEYTVVKNATEVGISCFGTKAVSMNNNKVSNCTKAGVGAYNGAVVKDIKNNVITGIGKGKTGSGINIVGAGAINIVGNKVTHCKGHGVSTNYAVYGRRCSIKVLDKNTINYNGVHGVYLNKSKISKSMRKNVIKGNKKCGIRVDEKSSVKGMRGNKITKNRSSDVSNVGKISKK